MTFSTIQEMAEYCSPGKLPEVDNSTLIRIDCGHSFYAVLMSLKTMDLRASNIPHYIGSKIEWRSFDANAEYVAELALMVHKL